MKGEKENSESEEQEFSFRIKKQTRTKTSKKTSKTKRLYKRVIKKIKKLRKAKKLTKDIDKLIDMKRQYEKELKVESVQFTSDSENEKKVNEHENKKEKITDLIQNEKELEGLEVVKDEETGKFQYTIKKISMGKNLTFFVLIFRK